VILRFFASDSGGASSITVRKSNHLVEDRIVFYGFIRACTLSFSSFLLLMMFNDYFLFNLSLYDDDCMDFFACLDDVPTFEYICICFTLTCLG
jgi:hypothetical protein